MGATLDVWTVVAKEGYAVILFQPAEYSRLTASGHPIEIDTDVVGDPSANHYYVVRGANTCGAVAAASGAWPGEVDFGLMR